MYGICVSVLIAGWLDDIGLPQYKNSFFEGRVDGRVLHNLTMVGKTDSPFQTVPFGKLAIMIDIFSFSFSSSHFIVISLS